jgi:hypothetical protein
MPLNLHTAFPKRPPTTHLKKGEIGEPFVGPACGQRAMDGKGHARTLYTTDPSRVTCQKCRKALVKTGPLAAPTTSTPTESEIT